MGILNKFFCLFGIFQLNWSAEGSKWESLTHIYDTYDEGPGLHHFYNYGPAYDENIHQLRDKAVSQGKKVKILEIGVQSGGSTRVWKRYFRGTCSYVGIDINYRCKQFESPEEGINVEIGSQLNTTFLSSICSKYGPFDLVVDDGGHTNDMIMTSLLSLWGCLNDDAVYVIEDLHALNMGEKYLVEGEVTVFEKIGQWMKIRSPRLGDRKNLSPAISTDHPAWHLKKLAFYDSMIFLYYGEDVQRLNAFKKGSYWMPYVSRKEPKETGHCVGCCVGCYDN